MRHLSPPGHYRHRHSVSGIASVNPAGGIQVFPNPTTGLINFKGIESGYRVDVYNVLGQVVHSSTATDENYSVNLSGNAKGVYFYRVTDNMVNVQQGKIVLE